MSNFKTVLFLAVLCWSILANAQGDLQWTINQKIPAAHLKKDLNKLHHSLYKNHPGLFDYIDAVVWDDLTDSIFMKADTAMTVMEFYRVFAPMVTKVACGHTVVKAGCFQQQCGFLEAACTYIKMVVQTTSCLKDSK